MIYYRERVLSSLDYDMQENGFRRAYRLKHIHIENMKIAKGKGDVALEKDESGRVLRSFSYISQACIFSFFFLHSSRSFSSFARSFTFSFSSFRVIDEMKKIEMIKAPRIFSGHSNLTREVSCIPQISLSPWAGS